MAKIDNDELDDEQVDLRQYRNSLPGGKSCSQWQPYANPMQKEAPSC
jgi:hypothetical protein